MTLLVLDASALALTVLFVLLLMLDRGALQTDEMRRRAARDTTTPNGRVRFDPLALARAARRRGRESTRP